MGAPEEAGTVGRVQAEYRNPGGWRAGDRDTLLHTIEAFLWQGVQAVISFKCSEAKVNVGSFDHFVPQNEKEQFVRFSTELRLRTGFGEKYLLGLEHWPLGVSGLRVAVIDH
jgi:hypothetical protein